MMIEAVPFFHILVNIIQSEVGDDVSVSCVGRADPQSQAIIATTMVSFAFSSILTGKSRAALPKSTLTLAGLVFFSLGAFKLGSLIGYFPRHILVGYVLPWSTCSGCADRSDALVESGSSLSRLDSKYHSVSKRKDSNTTSRPSGCFSNPSTRSPSGSFPSS
jgi:hypothetical protein